MKSIGLSEDSSFVPTLINYYPLPDINFNEDCLKNNNNDPSLGAVNLYICYTLDRWSRDLNADFILGNCLFESIKLTKNADPDSCSGFALTDGSMGKNVIIFGAGMSSSVHIDKKNKDILIPGEGPTQGLDDTTLTAEAKYPENFTQSNRKFVLSLHYNGSGSFLFKAKDSELKKVSVVFR